MALAQLIHVRSRTAVSLVVVGIAASVLSSNVNATAVRRPRPHRQPPLILTVPEGTRLLVVAPHSDDELLAIGGLMQRVHETGGTVRTATTPPDHIHAATISQDGKTLISAGQSGSLYLWDTTAGKLIATFAVPKPD